MKSRKNIILIITILLLVAGCLPDGFAGTTDPVQDNEAVKSNPGEWTHRSNPVFISSGTGWERAYVESPSVIKWNGVYGMWYTGSPSTDGFKAGIGYATSTDGMNWERVGNRPVLAPDPDSWDRDSVMWPVVLYDGDTLHMWYAGGTSHLDHDIGYAASVDGINWNRRPEPVLVRGNRGEWNSKSISPGAVIKEDGHFKMWYFVGSFPPSPTKGGIGYATSADGINWILYDDPETTEAPYEFSDPVLPPGPSSSSWDANVDYGVSVIRTAEGYEMWYTGWPGSGDFVNARIGHASSPDGITWTKHDNNPVLSTPSWSLESHHYSNIHFPSVLADGEGYRMWFSTRRWPQPLPLGVIGYAEIDLLVR